MRLQTRLAALPALSFSDPSVANGKQIEFSPGHLDFNKYRSYVSAVRETSEPFRFVDGELIERFLDLEGSVQQSVCEGLGVGAEDLRGVVEGLRRLC